MPPPSTSLLSQAFGTWRQYFLSSKETLKRASKKAAFETLVQGQVLLRLKAAPMEHWSRASEKGIPNSSTLNFKPKLTQSPKRQHGNSWNRGLLNRNAKCPCKVRDGDGRLKSSSCGSRVMSRSTPSTP